MVHVLISFGIHLQLKCLNPKIAFEVTMNKRDKQQLDTPMIKKRVPTDQVQTTNEKNSKLFN